MAFRCPNHAHPELRAWHPATQDTISQYYLDRSKAGRNQGADVQIDGKGNAYIIWQDNVTNDIKSQSAVFVLVFGHNKKLKAVLPWTETNEPFCLTVVPLPDGSVFLLGPSQGAQC